MNWDDPAERFRLADRLGPEGYNKAFEEHVKATTVATVNGYGIRPIGTRWGRLFMVMGTDSAFHTLEEATAYADLQPAP